jgi:hypothetical protein
LEEDMKRIRERGKVRLELVCRAALEEEAKALDAGNRKPGRGAWNWRRARISGRDMAGAALRHIAAWLDGEDIDADSLAHHLGAARARLGIILDARRAGTLDDDRVAIRRRR